MKTTNESPVRTDRLCHIYGIEDADKAYDALSLEYIKSYGDRTVVPGTNLTVHWNHNCEDGERALVRCRSCGALFLLQHSSWESWVSDTGGSYSDWIPVWSEEEADLLSFTANSDLADDSCRHLRRNNRTCCWYGTDDPAPRDVDTLRREAELLTEEVIAQSKAEGKPE